MVQTKKRESVAKRRRAYESGVHLWRFQDIPPTVTQPDGLEKSNPLRRTAVFVVHGMGEQAYLDTAITLRNGFEDAIDGVLDLEQENIPVPFTFEGYWGNYANFEQTFPDEWATFNERERRLFSGLWRRRVTSTFRTFGWFAWQSFRLVWDRGVIRRAGIIRWPLLLLIAIGGLISFLAILLRHPKIMATVLADVRLYLDPRGDIEKAIVQRIDRRVGEKFLLLLGLDWEFHTLPPEKQLRISGQRHAFDYVTWVAHSLGSVISYNAISDLLARCMEIRKTLDGPESGLSVAERKELRDNIKRVEKGLHRFFTFGSPLGKIALLFPGSLRAWPAGHTSVFRKDRRMWINFYHIWDPVSGVLRADETEEEDDEGRKGRKYFASVVNLHGRLLRIPLLAHGSYWKDKPILTHVISRAYGRNLLDGSGAFVAAWRIKLVSRTFNVATATVVLLFVRFADWERIWPQVQNLAAILISYISGGRL